MKSVQLILSICFSITLLQLSSCSFQGDQPSLCELELELDSLNQTPASNSFFENILDKPSYQVFHGSVEAKTNEIFNIPVLLPNKGGFGKAEVILNGWEFDNGGNEENISFLGVDINSLILTRAGLDFRIYGKYLQGKTVKAKFYFTAILWNNDLDAISVKGNLQELCKNAVDGTESIFVYDNKNFETALTVFQNNNTNTIFAMDRSPMVQLPRGQVFINDSRSIWDDLFGRGTQLLQLAYHHEALEGISLRRNNNRMVADSNYYSWKSNFILKDNDDKRPARFGEHMSGICGKDLTLIQPQFSILPDLDEYGGTVIDVNNNVEKEYIIDNLAFESAIPLLTGYDIRYQDGDDEVDKIGVYIKNWRFISGNEYSGGKLIYTLGMKLQNEDDDNGVVFNHKISILGLKKYKLKERQPERPGDVLHPDRPINIRPTVEN